jgi:hypothetical protein
VLIQPEGGITSDVRYPSASRGWACLAGGLLPIQIQSSGSLGFPHVIAGENSFFGKLREGAPVLPGGVFRWQSFRSFSLKACDIAFKCLTGSSMVFAILCLLPDASIRVTAKKISPFSALSLNTPTHAFPKASLISAPLVPIKRPATRAVGSFASLDCPEEGLFNPNVSNAAQTFS